MPSICVSLHALAPFSSHSPDARSAAVGLCSQATADKSDDDPRQCCLARLQAAAMYFIH